MCKFSFPNYQKCTYFNGTKILYKVNPWPIFVGLKKIYTFIHLTNSMLKYSSLFFAQYHTSVILIYFPEIPKS